MRWLTPDIARIENRIDTMLQAIAGRETTDDFDGFTTGTPSSDVACWHVCRSCWQGATGVELPGAAR